MPFFGFPQYIQHKTCKKMRIYPVSTSLFTDIIHFPFQTFSDVFRVYRKGKYSRVHCVERMYWPDKIPFSCLFFLDSLITKDRGMQNNQEIVLQFSWVKKRVEGHVLFRLKLFSVGDFLKIDLYWRITQRYTNVGLKISLYVCVHMKTNTQQI